MARPASDYTKAREFSAACRRKRRSVCPRTDVKLGVGVIVTIGNNATIAAHGVTKTVPIVALNVGDPVRMGLAASFARPGVNVTGSTVLSDELSMKRVQLLMEMLPNLARIGEFVDPTSPQRLIVIGAFFDSRIVCPSSVAISPAARRCDRAPKGMTQNVP